MFTPSTCFAVKPETNAKAKAHCTLYATRYKFCSLVTAARRILLLNSSVHSFHEGKLPVASCRKATNNFGYLGVANLPFLTTCRANHPMTSQVTHSTWQGEWVDMRRAQVTFSLRALSTSVSATCQKLGQSVCVVGPDLFQCFYLVNCKCFLF